MRVEAAMKLYSNPASRGRIIEWWVLGYKQKSEGGGGYVRRISAAGECCRISAVYAHLSEQEARL